MISQPMKRSLAVAAVLAAFAGTALAQKDAKSGKTHRLAATLETVQWGWLDPRESPKLTIDSGDTVSIETMMHSHDKVQPGMTMEQVVELRKAKPGGGPHSVTGPIYVNGAEPGDVLEIRILKIVPKAYGVNFNLPGTEFPTIGALAALYGAIGAAHWVLRRPLLDVSFNPRLAAALRSRLLLAWAIGAGGLARLARRRAK